MLVYPSGVDVSSSACRFLAARLRKRRRALGDRLFYSGKRKKHGMNVQAIADPKGRLLWASPAPAGAVHGVRGVREHGIIDALAEAGISCWADKGYRGAGGTARLPYRGRGGSLSVGQQAVSRSHGKVRELVEQAIATLKSWRLPRKLRCSTTRITSVVRAVLTLHLASSDWGWKSSMFVADVCSSVPRKDQRTKSDCLPAAHAPRSGYPT